MRPLFDEHARRLGAVTKLARVAAAVSIAFVGAGLGGCAAALPSDQYDACTTHASWVSEGSPADDVTRLAGVLQSEVPASAEGPVASATTTLVDAIEGGDPDAISAASASLTSACDAAGWEPVEG